MASPVATVNPSPVPSTVGITYNKSKSDLMDVDDDDEDGQSDIAIDEQLPSHTRPSSTASTIAPIDASAPVTSAHSLSSPTSADEPAASVVYIPGAVLPTLTKYVGRLLDIRIACRYLSTRSKEVLTRQLWGGGDGYYTDDSDAVCLLIHSGLQIVRANPPVDVSGNGGVVMTVRVAEAREQYTATERNGLKSRSWISKYHRLSLQVVSCDVTDNINATRSKATAAATTTVTATATTSVASTSSPVPASSSAAASSSSTSKKDKKELRQLKMLVVDKPAGSASSAGGYARLKATKRKYIPECSVSFGDDESVWLHYSLWAVSDRAVDESSWCSARIRGEMLRLEGRDGRFELRRESRKGEKRGSAAAAATAHSQLHTSTVPFAAILSMKATSADFDTYSWTTARKEGAVVSGGGGGSRRNGAASSGDVVSGLDWSELEWSPDGVRVRGRDYRIERVRWEKL